MRGLRLSFWKSNSRKIGIFLFPKLHRPHSRPHFLYFYKVSIIFDTSNSSLLYKWVYVSKVILILACPRYLLTKTILAPCCIKKLAHECLKSCILICFTSANLQYLFFLACIVDSLNGNSSPNTNHLSEKYFFFFACSFSL